MGGVTASAEGRLGPARMRSPIGPHCAVIGGRPDRHPSCPSWSGPRKDRYLSGRRGSVNPHGIRDTPDSLTAGRCVLAQIGDHRIRAVFQHRRCAVSDGPARSGTTSGGTMKNVIKRRLTTAIVGMLIPLGLSDPAFSTAVGLVLSSSKNDTFNAGLIFGKDFLSRSDRKSDPDAGDIWFSVYVGYSM